MVSVSPKSVTFTNGSANDASQVDSEMTALFNNDNTLATAVTDIENGNIKSGTTLTINSSFGGSPTNNISVVANRGSSTDTVIRWNETNDWWEATHDGTNYYPISLVRSSDPSSPSNGYVWYNTTDNQLKARINSTTVSIGGNTLIGFISGKPVTYTSASTVTIPSGLRVASDDGATLISFTSNQAVALTTSGANGLDTGSEAGNTWYYLWAIRKSSDGTVGGLLSTSRTSPTMPSGYDQKALLPLAIRNDGSSNIIPFVIGQGWPYSPFVEYNVHIGDQSAVGSNNVLNAGTSGTFSAVDLSSLIPPISTMAYLKALHFYSGAGGQFRLRATGESHNGVTLSAPNSSTSRNEAFLHVPTNTSQSIDYMNSGTSTTNYLWVVGYTVNA